MAKAIFYLFFCVSKLNLEEEGIIMSKTFSKEYLRWSKEAQKARIDRNMTNKFIAEKLGYSRQLVTAVINGRKESSIAIARISKQLGILKPESHFD